MDVATAWEVFTASFTLPASRRQWFSRRALGPLRDLDFLFDEVIGRRRPLRDTGRSAGPEVRAVAVSATHAGASWAAVQSSLPTWTTDSAGSCLNARPVRGFTRTSV